MLMVGQTRRPCILTPTNPRADTAAMAQRPPLSLTAELERLEQQITLTYQGALSPASPVRFLCWPTGLTTAEIDHNFAKAHRIVTGSILPIVERYAKESEAVWEGSKARAPTPCPLSSPLTAGGAVLEAVLRGQCKRRTLQLPGGRGAGITTAWQ